MLRSLLCRSFIIVLAATLLCSLPAAAALSPAAPVTRLELASILTDGLSLSPVSADSSFRDLPKSQLDQDAVLAVHQAGLMAGFPGHLFRPEGKVTRAQAVTILLAASGMAPHSPAVAAPIMAERAAVSSPFADISAKHWAAPYIIRAWQKGLVAGTSSGRFSPDEAVTAWELAQFVHRFLGSDVAERAGLKALLRSSMPVPAKDSATAVPVLLYHHLAPAGSGFDTNGATITPEEFHWQMDYLAAEGYKVLTPEELAAFLSGDLRVPKRSVAITFDDGYASNLKYAHPILKEHGFPAIIHVITGTVPAEPQQPYDRARLQSLSWPELKKLADEGLITIASHSDNLHQYLPSGLLGLQRPALVAQITDPATGKPETAAVHYQRICQDLTASRTKLLQQLNISSYILAYPYGASDSAARRATTEAGFTLTFGTKAALARAGSGTSDVPRLVVPPGISPEKFQRLLNP